MITLHCDRQTLHRLDEEKIVAGGFGFVRFCYTCDESWEGYSVSAQFHRLGDDSAYHVASIQPNRSYAVPHEVLIEGGVFTVCLFGVKGSSSRATSNVVTIAVCEDGLLDHTLPTPTPDIFNQYVQAVLSVGENAAQAAAAAQRASENAKESEAYIRSVLVEEEFAAQVADWNASFATDVKNAKAALEKEKNAAVSLLRGVGEQCLETVSDVHENALLSYEKMHTDAMRDYQNQAKSKQSALQANFAHLVIAGSEAKQFDQRLSRLEEKNISLPMTFHVIEGGYNDLPDPLEWFLAHPLGGGRYTQVGYSEPIFAMSSESTWTCYTVSYTYAEIDMDNVDESAAWTEVNFTKKSDLPKASTSYGTMIDQHNFIEIYPATENIIKQGTHAFQPIVPKHLGYGVGCHSIARLSSMPNAASKYLDWVVLYTGQTDEKYTADTLYTCKNDGGYKWVEYTPAPIGDIEAALDSIIAIQNSFLGGESV